MANLTRSAKSGCDWTSLELLAYNITVELQKPLSFFGRELLSIDHLDSNLFSSTDPDTILDLSKDTYRFLVNLKDASRANPFHESAVHELARGVMEVTRFDGGQKIPRSRYEICFTMCGDGDQEAIADVCLLQLKNSIILLVVHEEPIDFRDPEPKVIAEAIAAFEHNNLRREKMGFKPLEAMTIPCITFVGTCPTFYMVPVTKQLSECVINGQYPEQTTVVTRCAPPPNGPAYEGMEVLEYRKAALQCYTTFREVAKEYWSKFIIDSV
ncbi:hypothetical protein BD410DRAFT_633059 [Rickenella mellea]|uniref:Uncharacterized protein n=1 Tax=Rickenella mellea TaxID=50990 RepID=A0A4Y7QDA7_9AGAM|nr:hypothetical protein BD410DRAFT_633059 [Rickenella mellea]